MKKLFIILSLIITLAVSGLIVFKFISKNTVDVTDSSKWTYITHDEFKVRLPENLKSTTKLYSSSLGAEQIACYKNNKIVFSVAKQQMTPDQVKNIDLKKTIQSISINGEDLVPIKVNSGYYYKFTGNSAETAGNENKLFRIEALFKGKDAIYSIAVSCPITDRTKYEESMTQWIESFSLR